LYEAAKLSFTKLIYPDFEVFNTRGIPNFMKFDLNTIRIFK